MFFGTKEKKYTLGSFTSEKCSACSECETYTFYKVIRFFVAFFVSLIPLGARFECECENCGDVVEVDAKAGRDIAKTRFGAKNGETTFLTAAKLFVFALIIAAAVVVPLLLTAPPAADPQTLKTLVSEDGIYNIQNKNGDSLAVAEVTDGQATLVYYAQRSKLVGEPGADGMTMSLNFEEDPAGTDDSITLKPFADSAGVLEDKYGTAVRSYHYDIAAQALGYSLGIADLSTIEYTEDKAVYPYTHYISNTQTLNYITVLHISDERRVSATFKPSAQDQDTLLLSEVLVSEYENGRQLGEKLYLISAAADDQIVFIGAVNPQSTADEIIAFIEQSEMPPTYSESYEYYLDTNVFSSITASIVDEAGMVQSATQDFDIEAKDGFYIISEHVEEVPAQ